MKTPPGHGGASAVLPHLIRRGGVPSGAAAFIVIVETLPSLPCYNTARTAPPPFPHRPVLMH